MELTDIVRCMSCRRPLELVENEAGERACKNCNWVAGAEILDFVVDPSLRDERAHYDGKWGKHKLVAPADADALHQLWTSDPRSPSVPPLRARIGDVRDKVVLVLGNGMSVKELSLLRDRPRLLAISDISLTALTRIRAHAREMEHDGNLAFAAIDALDMPLEDNSIDVLYGVYFVSQLPDVDQFLREAARVLAPGGRAIFKDRGYAPLFVKAKRRALSPVTRASHKAWTLSPNDQIFIASGGFKPDELDRQIRAVGGVPWFERSGFVHYGATVASRSYSPPESRWRLDASSWERQDGRWRLKVRHARLLSVLTWIDRVLHRLPIVRQNEIRLAWGFDMEDTKVPAERVETAASAVAQP
jgi:SAM-dependent methyltransferase